MFENLNATSASRLRYWENPWFKWVAIMMVAMIYLLNRSPYVGFNDGLSFLLDAESGFSWYTNATSHFLYNNIQHILVKAFFFVDPVMVLTLFSIMCALLTLMRVYQAGKMLAGFMPTVMVPPMILAMSFTFWQQSEIIEVYAFNNLIFINYFYFALKDMQRNEAKNTILVSLLLGLGVLTHIQHVLSLPFFIYYLVKAGKKQIGKAIGGGVLFGVLFFILFLIPLITHNNSFSAIFFDNHFKDDVLGMDLKMLGKGMLMGMLFLMYNFHVFLFFILHGWFLLWKDRRILFWQLMLLLIPYFAFAVKYSVSDNHVFFLIAYMVLVIPSIFSFNYFAMKLMKHMSWMIPAMMMMGPMMYAGATMMAANMEMTEKYDQEKSYKGGLIHLLWPGKAWAKDPLALVKEMKTKAETELPPVEWNFKAGAEYLELLESKNRKSP